MFLSFINQDNEKIIKVLRRLKHTYKKHKNISLLKYVHKWRLLSIGIHRKFNIKNQYFPHKTNNRCLFSPQIRQKNLTFYKNFTEENDCDYNAVNKSLEERKYNSGSSMIYGEIINKNRSNKYTKPYNFSRSIEKYNTDLSTTYNNINHNNSNLLPYSQFTGYCGRFTGKQDDDLNIYSYDTNLHDKNYSIDYYKVDTYNSNLFIHDNLSQNLNDTFKLPTYSSSNNIYHPINPKLNPEISNVHLLAAKVSNETRGSLFDIKDKLNKLIVDKRKHKLSEELKKINKSLLPKNKGQSQILIQEKGRLNQRNKLSPYLSVESSVFDSEKSRSKNKKGLKGRTKMMHLSWDQFKKADKSEYIFVNNKENIFTASNNSPDISSNTSSNNKASSKTNKNNDENSGSKAEVPAVFSEEKCKENNNNIFIKNVALRQKLTGNAGNCCKKIVNNKFNSQTEINCTSPSTFINDLYSKDNLPSSILENSYCVTYKNSCLINSGYDIENERINLIQNTSSLGNNKVADINKSCRILTTQSKAQLLNKSSQINFPVITTKTYLKPNVINWSQGELSGNNSNSNKLLSGKNRTNVDVRTRPFNLEVRKKCGVGEGEGENVGENANCSVAPSLKQKKIFSSSTRKNKKKISGCNSKLENQSQKLSPESYRSEDKDKNNEENGLSQKQLMISSQIVNECFKGEEVAKNRTEEGQFESSDKKSVITLQTINDSKLMEMAGGYIMDESLMNWRIANKKLLEKSIDNHTSNFSPNNNNNIIHKKKNIIKNSISIK